MKGKSMGGRGEVTLKDLLVFCGLGSVPLDVAVSVSVHELDDRLFWSGATGGSRFPIYK